MISNFFKKEEGFTMVELIVAMSVFAIIIPLAVGVFVRTIKTQRELTHRMAINDNTGLVLEQMTRQIRTGYDFCNNDGASVCSISGANRLDFTNHEGELVSYFLSGNSINRTIGGNTESLTASNVSVEDLSFIVRQKDNDLCNPWLITVRMRVGSERLDPNNDTRLQTSISSRVLPIEMPGAHQDVINNCRMD